MTVLHTFVFADLAGFTAFTESEGDEAAADLALRFGEAARQLAESHDAHFVKSLGDGVLLAPHGAAEAVCLGLDLADDLGSRSDLMPMRIGMHTGPAVGRDGDWFGAAVNLAARLGSAAGAGEVLLSAETATAAGPLPGVELEPLGPRQLRGIARSVDVLRAQRTRTAHSVAP